MKRLLSLSTLYPAPGRTGFGRFVARQMEALAARGDWDVTVINPIGLPPLPLHKYEALRAIPEVEAGAAIKVFHPRFTLIPGLSGPINPGLIARAVLPLARRLHGVGGAGVEGSACISAGAGAIGAGGRSAAAIGVGLSAGAR